MLRINRAGKQVEKHLFWLAIDSLKIEYCDNMTILTIGNLRGYTNQLDIVSFQKGLVFAGKNI